MKKSLFFMALLAFAATAFINAQNILQGSDMEDGAKWESLAGDQSEDGSFDGEEFGYSSDALVHGVGGCLRIDFSASKYESAISRYYVQPVTLQRGEWYKTAADVTFLNGENGNTSSGLEFLISTIKPIADSNYNYPLVDDIFLITDRKVSLEKSWYPVTVNGDINDTIDGGEWGKPENLKKALRNGIDSVMYEGSGTIDVFFTFKLGFWYAIEAAEDTYNFNVLIDNIILYSGARPERPSGINDIKINSISVYPTNPSETISISGLTNNANVNIYNTLGQLVASFDDVNNTDALNISTLSNGMYIMEINSGNINTTSKFIKKN